MIGIYKIKNKSNGKIYIGQSVDILGRWEEHINQGKAATIYEDEFHFELFNNPSDFMFSILEICQEEELQEREQYYINKYNSIEKGYNKIAAAKSNKKKKIIAITNRDIVNRLNELCGKPLFIEDKTKLALFLGYRDKRGNLLGWKTVKKHLEKNGFEIIETKRIVKGKSKNCSIISVRYEY